jgi:hypothetical protein
VGEVDARTVEGGEVGDVRLPGLVGDPDECRLRGARLGESSASPFEVGGVLGDAGDRGAVAQHVGEGVDVGRQVHRHGDRTQQQAGDVDEVELRPVAQQEDDVVAAPDTEGSQPACDPGSPLCVAVPGELAHAGTVVPAERRLVTALGDGAPQRVEQGRVHPM